MSNHTWSFGGLLLLRTDRSGDVTNSSQCRPVDQRAFQNLGLKLSGGLSGEAGTMNLLVLFLSRAVPSTAMIRAPSSCSSLVIL
jgi:hypothetical protein